MSEAPCPRCTGTDTEVHHVARAGHQLLWRVLHCRSCSFTWRSTEPSEVLDHDLRPEQFRLRAEADRSG